MPILCSIKPIDETIRKTKDAGIVDLISQRIPRITSYNVCYTKLLRKMNDFERGMLAMENGDTSLADQMFNECLLKGIRVVESNFHLGRLWLSCGKSIGEGK